MNRRRTVVALICVMAIAATATAQIHPKDFEILKLKARILDTQDRLKTTEAAFVQVIDLVKAHGDSALTAQVTTIANTGGG